MKLQLKNKKIINVQCQQYLIGLYVCIYDDKTGRMIDQFTLNTTTEKFLQDVKNDKVFKGKIIE